MPAQTPPLPPLSSEFTVRLEPERRLRRSVCAFAGLAAVIGVLAIQWLPVEGVIKVFCSALWVACVGAEIARFLRNCRRIGTVLLRADASVSLMSVDGTAVSGRLVSGAVIGKRLAWLRVRLTDRRVYAELFAGDAVKDPQWHRLQLWWHQCGRAGGR